MAVMDKPQSITVGSVRIEVKSDKLLIYPNKPRGLPVVVDARKLERWAAKMYRDGVLQT
jgi:hypothetical protein